MYLMEHYYRVLSASRLNYSGLYSTHHNASNRARQHRLGADLPHDVSLAETGPRPASRLTSGSAAHPPAVCVHVRHLLAERQVRVGLLEVARLLTRSLQAEVLHHKPSQLLVCVRDLVCQVIYNTFITLLNF